MFTYFKTVTTVLLTLLSLNFAQNTLSVEVGDGTFDVLYNSNVDIAGLMDYDPYLGRVTESEK